MTTDARKYSIYMHVFPNKKVYIGMTSRPPYQRWSGGHGYKGQPLLWEKIIKYGWKNIQHYVIDTGLTKEEAEAKEIQLIQKHRANDRRFGYNIENGGTSIGKVSDETREKLRERTQGENNPFYGKHLTEEHKTKIRNTRKERDIQPVNKRPVRCVETGIIYESTAQATRELGIHNFAIRRVCYGERKTAGGYHWEYVDN